MENGFTWFVGITSGKAEGEEEGIMEYRTVAMTRPRSEARVRIDIFDDLRISLLLHLHDGGSLPFLTPSEV
jgi:hypothetical protein